MEFRTALEPLKMQGFVTHESPVMLVGSCFSDNIGRSLADGLFDVEVNPFGTLYNPASISRSLYRIMSDHVYTVGDLIEHDGRYHSFEHHSSFSGVNAQAVVANMNNRLAVAADFLRKASVLVVTFGTAYVYRLGENGDVVSNCHKLPSRNFERGMMSVDEVLTMWRNTISQLREVNANLKIVFTVSPIRHLADGAHDNQLSKSTLLLAVDALCRELDGVVYFPAYEIMMDDLRDYRFYAPDMTHPSEVAVNYIYDVFSRSFFNASTLALSQECRRLTRRLNHRHLTDDMEAIARFEQTTSQIINKLLLAHPCLGEAVRKTLRL